MLPGASLRSAAAAAALLCGCRVFDASLLDAGHDGGPLEEDVVVPDAGPGCELRLPPDRPDAGDGPDVEEAVFAVHEISFDYRDDRWRTAGYDLDGLCSYPPEPIVECVPPSPSAPLETDGEGGTDNALGHNLFDLLLFAVPDLGGHLQLALSEGNGVPVIRVRGWNGTPNDPQVDALLTQSAFGTPGLPDGAPPDVPDGSVYRLPDGASVIPPFPEYAGNDYFWVRGDTFLDGNLDRPRVRDDRAYVVDSTLVMTLPARFPIRFSGGFRTMTVTFTDAVITGRIAPDGRSLEDVILGGRWPVVDLIGTLDAAGVCEGTTERNAIERVTDFAADVRAMPGTGGAGVLCDAISVGLTGRGLRAHIGGISDLYGISVFCADAGMLDAGAEDAGEADASAPDAGDDAGTP